MNFIKDGRYPITIQDIYRENPQTSFPPGFDPTEFGYLCVLPVQKPEYAPITQTILETPPVQVDDKWYEQWEVVSLPNDVIAANVTRAKALFIAAVTTATQSRLDDFARTRNYDGILSACTYATSPTTKFAVEGQYCVNARDATWARLYAIMSDVEAALIPMPESVQEVLAMLPLLEWPT